MKYVEVAGLVKFDFLGLKTLSVLKRATELLADRHIDIDLDTLSWDDPQVYELLQRGDTVGVFQLESEGMRRTLAAVRPSNFGDIIALVSLYRPGPMDNIPSFGARKNGREKIEYPHPLLETILAETYGIFVYQEQVMQAAQILAGYSLGGADMLRRAMGKKIKSEMDAQRATFVDGCATHNNIPAAKANELFDLIDKFAGYGFNKSHAAAYALLAYQTAWLKAHYPHEFYAASMAFDIDQTDKLAIFADDMKRMGVQVLGPDINASQASFVVQEGEGQLAVRYALAALKGVGERAMEQLVEERDTNGRFHSLDDLARRVDPRLLNKRQVETLAGAGAFDTIEPNRAGVFAAAETILAVAQRTHENRTSGQGGLFGESERGGGAIALPRSANWSLANRINAERDAFGYYFSAHPLDRYQHLARAYSARAIATLGEVPIAEGQRVGATVAALIEDARWRTSARGNRYMMATISDTSGQVPVSCFEESTASDMEECARAGGCAILTIEMDKRPGEDMPRVAIRRVQSFEALAGSARLVLDLTVTEPMALPMLAALIGDQRDGRCTVKVNVPVGAQGSATLTLGRDFRIDEEMVGRIRDLPGVTAAELGNADAPLAAAA